MPASDGVTAITQFNVANNQLGGSLASSSARALAGKIQGSGAVICPNRFDIEPVAEWDLATGRAPWYATPSLNNRCDSIFANTFE